MRDVYVVGVGQVAVTKHGTVRGRHMAARAIKAALDRRTSAGPGPPS